MFMQRHPRKTEFGLVTLFFGLLAALFMGPILFHFGSAVHGFWGDGTGGIIWLNNLNLPMFGGFTDAVIYPYGDNLFRPDFITASLLVAPFWVISKIIGAIATWNLIVMLAFWLAGISMYYLIKRLTGSPQAALWAGVAFAYMPIHQYKAFGHIAYVLVFIFVFVIWQVINFINNPTKKNGLLLGLLTVLPFYIDGYFVLFTLILVGVPLFITLATAIYKLSRNTVADFKALLRSLGVFLATSFVLLLPIAAFKVLYGAQISAGLATARGDFMSNVTVYTSRWYDFLVPIETHPVFGTWATAFRQSHNHGSNTSEHTLYVGFVLLALAGWTVYFLWKNRHTKRVKAFQDLTVNRTTLVVLLIVAGFAFLITLQPFVTIFGVRVPMPSRILSEFVQYWRVYARLIIIIQLILVIVASVGLAILLSRVQNKTKAWALVGLLITITFFESLSFNPFQRQDIWYYNKLSTANQWLKKHKDINVIAVYPLVDQPNHLASLYTTEQVVHGKKMINSGTISANKTRLRASIAGLNDPQTLSVLKALGVQAIMTHEIPDDRKVTGLEYRYGANDAPAGYAADVDIFAIDASIKAARYALVPTLGVRDVTDVDLRTKHFINPDGVVDLQAERMPGIKEKKGEERVFNFALRTTEKYTGNSVVVTQGDKVIDVIKLDSGRQTAKKSYNADVAKPIKLTVVGPFAADSIYLRNLTVDN